MTFAPGTKVRYKAHIAALTALTGIEGVVTETRHHNTTMIKVTKGSDIGHHDYLIGSVEGFSTSGLVLVEEAPKEKLKEGGEISYEQVERGQRIRVSYEANGVIFSREGVVGKVKKSQSVYGTKTKDNWTINVLDDEAERFGGKGQRLNWGSEKNKETIVLLENAPEVDAVLERLLESKGGTVIRAFENQFLVRDAFSDTWRNWSSQKSYSSETLRREAGDKIVFFVEDMEGH